jgi:hypothetical protein
MEVTVRTESQFLTSRTSGYGTSTDHERYKAHQVSLNVDAESSPEK